MTTYTIVSTTSGEAVERGLSIRDAAETLLTADTFTYDIVREVDGDGYRLMLSRSSGASTGPRGMTASVFFSLENDYHVAEAEIFAAVVAHDGDWHGLEAMTDAAYDDVLAAVAEDDEG